MRFLTIDDVKTKGKTVFLRVDMNCPIDPKTMEISGKKRIEESIIPQLTDVSDVHLEMSQERTNQRVSTVC